MKTRSHLRLMLGAALVTATIAIGSGAAVAVTDDPTPVPANTATTSMTAVGEEEGPKFAAGVAVDVAQDVDGDVYAAGQSVTISGRVHGDVLAAAQTVTITGSVDGDVRLSAQVVTISGAVAGSGTVAAQTLDVPETGSIGADLVASAGTAVVNGRIGRNAVLSVGTLRVDGTVGGDLTYTSGTDATIAQGAVDGSVVRTEPPQESAAEVSPAQAIAGWLLGLLYGLAAFGVISVVAALLAPRVLRTVTGNLLPTPWRALLVGFVAFLAVPIAVLFAAVTIVGAPLALFALLTWIVMILASLVYSAHYIGRLIFRRSARPVVQTLVGGLILVTALTVPWLGVVVWFGAVFIGMGAQLLEIGQHRPWRSGGSAVGAPDA